ncbi:MAG: hypothetical protein JNM84_03180 [Planctomycetes bacterium]|nr:hypothetical protein [Planctomycetota bacterium]
MLSFTRWAPRIAFLGLASTMVDAQVPSEAPRIDYVVREADGTPVPSASCHLWIRTPDAELVESWTGSTTANGEGRKVLDEQERELLARGATFELVVPLPIGGETRRTWDPRRREPVELRLAPSGKMDLILCDEAGRPLESGVHFCLRVGEGIDPSARRDMPTERERGSIELDSYERGFDLWAENGRVLTPHVAIGQRVRIEIHQEDKSRPEVERVCDGPRAQGEIVSCPLRAAPPLSHLDLRLCDPSGAPIPDTAYAYRFDGACVRDPYPDVRTGSRGELAILLGCDIDLKLAATPIPEKAAGLEIWAPIVNPRWRARLELAPERFARGGDLGEVRAQEIPVGVRGVVIDSAGRTIPDRAVVLAKQPLESKEQYSGWHLMSSTTDAEGRFEIRVPEEIDRVSLRVVHSHESASSPSNVLLELEGVEPRSPRSLDLQLVLPALGKLGGRVLWDDFVGGFGLALVLEDARGAFLQKEHVYSIYAPPSPFEFDRLRAGESYTLHLGVEMVLVAPRGASGHEYQAVHPFGRAGIHVLRTIERLKLPSNGTPCEDPRLREIDLRGELVTREVTVLDAANRPLANQGIAVALRLKNGEIRSTGATCDAQGRARWLSPQGVLELWLGKGGHALVPLDPQKLQQTIKLSAEPPHSLELLLEDPPPLLPPHVQLTLELRQEDALTLWWAALGGGMLRHTATVHEGRARFALSFPGTCYVCWKLASHRGERSDILWQDYHSLRPVVVRDQPGLQRQTLSWPREEIAEALRKAKH